MTAETFKYDFFISYRHGDPDTDTAHYLQKALERYRIPKDIQKKYKKEKIRRVFRDNEELSASFDLAGEIREQLKNSEYLIVICSPRAKESIWVQKEISTFIELRGRKYILPVLIEGEPADSFPDLLMETEPLAADFRGRNTREIHKNCRREMLRLVAPVLHCSYDELKQRHRAYRMRRYAATSAVLAALFLSFGLYSFYQSVQIAENYRQKQINQSRFLAQESADLMESGDREAALLVAKAALPESEDSDDKPLVGEAQAALEDALYLYRTSDPDEYYPQKTLELNDTLQSIYDVDRKNDVLACCDQQDNIYFWDLQEGSAYDTYRLSDPEDELTQILLGENQTAYLSGYNTIQAYDYAGGKVLWTQQPDDAVTECALSPDGQILACSLTCYPLEPPYDEYTKILFLDAASGERLSEVPIYPDTPDLSLTASTLEWQPDSSALSVSLSNTIWSGNEQNQISLVRPDSGSVQTLAQWNGAPCHTLAFAGSDTLIYLKGFSFELNLNYMYSSSDYTVEAIDCSSGETLWSVTNTAISRNGYLDLEIVTSPSEEGEDTDTVCVQADTEVLYIQDGQVVGEFPYGQNVVNTLPGHVGYRQLHITADGIAHYAYPASPDSPATILNEEFGRTDLGLDDIGLAELTDSGKLILIPNNGQSIYIYAPAGDPAVDKVPDSPYLTSTCMFSPSGEYYVGIDYTFTSEDGSSRQAVVLRRADSGDILWEQEFDYSSDAFIGFFGDEYCYYLGDTSAILYSLSEQAVTGTYQPDEELYPAPAEFQAVSGSSPRIFFIGAEGLMTLSGPELSLSPAIPTEQLAEHIGWEPVFEDDAPREYDYSYASDSAGRYIAVWADASSSSGGSEVPLSIYDAENGQFLELPQINILSDSSWTDLPVCVFSEDSTKALIYDSNRQVRIIDLAQGIEEDSVPLDGDSYRAFWLSPDNRYLFLHSRQHLLSIYDLQTDTYTMETETVVYDITDHEFARDGEELRLITSYPNAFPIGFILKRTDEGVYECISNIGTCLDVSETQVLSADNEALYMYPRRSLNEMLDMADDILEGQELTELEKQRYFIEE